MPPAARAELGGAARAARIGAEGRRDQARRAEQARRRARWRERFRAAVAGFDPWAELGIARDATRAEIKRAYRAAALRWHPDRGGSAEKMARVNRAWAILAK